MRYSEHALDWAIDYLEGHNSLTVQAHHKMVETAYSVVYQIATSKGVVYLKQTPEGLSSEPDMLSFLNLQGCFKIPQIMAQNNQLHCFIMTSAGDLSLRQLFDDKIHSDLLIQGVNGFTSIQRTLEHKTEQLFKLGTPDWRLHRLPTLYFQLISNDKLLKDDGLFRDEIKHLHQLYPQCIQLCETLSTYHIPETINHCDFHENNMLIEKKSGMVSIIDWGETVVSHPFFSLAGFLWNMTYFHKLGESDDIFKTLQAQSLYAWLDVHHEKDLLKALGIAMQLNGVFAALSYQVMYEATQHFSKTVQQAHHGAIAGCLRSFMS